MRNGMTLRLIATMWLYKDSLSQHNLTGEAQTQEQLAQLISWEAVGFKLPADISFDKGKEIVMSECRAMQTEILPRL